MVTSILVYEVYVVMLAIIGVLVAEYLFYRIAGSSYLNARAELERIASDFRNIEHTTDKRVRRRVGKLYSRIASLQGMVRRYTLLRLGLLTPIYLGAITVFTLRPIPLPSLCCIPVLTLVPGDSDVCVTVPSLLAALTFLISLPIIQYDLVGILMLKKARQQTS